MNRIPAYFIGDSCRNEKLQDFFDWKVKTMSRGTSAFLGCLGLALIVLGAVCCRQQNTGPSGVITDPSIKQSQSGSTTSIVASKGSAESVLPASSIRFIDATETSKIAFLHEPHRTKNRWMPEIMGSGLLLADFNRDGACDALIVNSGIVGEATRPAGSENRLFLNDGYGVFRDVTAEWGLPSRAYGMGGAVGDIDNDGWPDVFLTTFGGGDQLLRNTGAGFEDITARAGIASDGKWSSSAAFFDCELDGDLDLYVTRYVEYNPETALKTFFNNVHVYSTPLLFSGVPDNLWINNGDGTFTDNSEALIEACRGVSVGSSEELQPDQPQNEWKGLAVGVCDIDNNGLPDIYVANDTTGNLLFVNQGNGQFTESARLAGVAYGDTGTEQAGMGVDFSDFNDDGKLGIVCSNFQGEPANLFFQSGPMFFVDRTDTHGVGQATRSRLQWGVKIVDFDNDGDGDMVMANGHLYDQVETMLTGVTFGQPNSLFENQGKGRFRDISESAGPALSDKQSSRGLAVADINSDGRLDFLVSNNGGTLQVAINETEQPGSFVSLWLEGAQSNRSATGAKITARTGERTIRQQIYGGTSYLSASDTKVHFGLAEFKVIDELTVHWPSGTNQTFRDIQVGRFYHLTEFGEPVSYVPGKAVFPPSLN